MFTHEATITTEPIQRGMRLQFTGDDLDELATVAKSHALVHGSRNKQDKSSRIRRQLLAFAEKALELSQAMSDESVDVIDTRAWDIADQLREAKR